MTSLLYIIDQFIGFKGCKLDWVQWRESASMAFTKLSFLCPQPYNSPGIKTAVSWDLHPYQSSILTIYTTIWSLFDIIASSKSSLQTLSTLNGLTFAKPSNIWQVYSLPHPRYGLHNPRKSCFYLTTELKFLNFPIYISGLSLIPTKLKCFYYL